MSLFESIIYGFLNNIIFPIVAISLFVLNPFSMPDTHTARQRLDSQQENFQLNGFPDAQFVSIVNTFSRRLTTHRLIMFIHNHIQETDIATNEIILRSIEKPKESKTEFIHNYLFSIDDVMNDGCFSKSMSPLCAR